MGHSIDSMYIFYVYLLGAVIAQWIVLRTEVRRAGWWLLAGSLAIIIQAAIYGLINEAVVRIDLYCISIAVMGAVLVWLLRKPIPMTPAQEEAEQTTAESRHNP